MHCRVRIKPEAAEQQHTRMNGVVTADREVSSLVLVGTEAVPREADHAQESRYIAGADGRHVWGSGTRGS